MRALVLRFEALMMSFGGPIVDHNNYTDRFPGTSMLTGMIGNAMGWKHRDVNKLQALQDSIQYAARWDRDPELLVEYQTADLGQPSLAKPGWTTRGDDESRGGGPAKRGTHQRYRHYWVDGLMTVALHGDITTIRHALDHPVRPLFIGRKSCIPLRHVVDDYTEGENLFDIIRDIPLSWGSEGPRPSCWPAQLGEDRGEIRRVYDLRDWKAGLPAGSRLRREGAIMCI